MHVTHANDNRTRRETTCPRSRIAYAGVLAAVIAAGLASRRWRRLLPAVIGLYAGDTLWALAVFVLCGLLLPRRSTRRVWVYSAAFSVAIEISQLYHAPWIDALRRTTLGGLMLGFGFLW